MTTCRAFENARARLTCLFLSLLRCACNYEFVPDTDYGRWRVSLLNLSGILSDELVLCDEVIMDLDITRDLVGFLGPSLFTAVQRGTASLACSVGQQLLVDEPIHSRTLAGSSLDDGISFYGLEGSDATSQLVEGNFWAVFARDSRPGTVELELGIDGSRLILTGIVTVLRL